MIYDKILYIIPYVCKDFISFPLVEEGNFTPFVNFWQVFENEKQKTQFEDKLRALLKPLDFCLEEVDNFHILYYYHIYPIYIIKKNGGYRYKTVWMLEDIIDVLAEYFQTLRKEKQNNELEGNRNEV